MVPGPSPRGLLLWQSSGSVIVVQGSVAPWEAESSQTRDWAHVSCIGMWILGPLNHQRSSTSRFFNRAMKWDHIKVLEVSLWLHWGRIGKKEAWGQGQLLVTRLLFWSWQEMKRVWNQRGATVIEEKKGRSPETDVLVGGRAPRIHPCWRERELLVEWLSGCRRSHS